MNRNHFHDFRYLEWARSYPYDIASFSGGTGFTIGMAQEDWEMADNYTPRIFLAFDWYSGSYTTESLSLLGNAFEEGKITRSMLQGGIYPMRIKFLKMFCFNLGMQVGVRLQEQVSGEYRASGYAYGGQIERQLDAYASNDFQVYFGAIARVAGKFELAPNWWIVPQYHFYLGLRPEMPGYVNGVKANRQHLSIGIRKGFGGSDTK